MILWGVWRWCWNWRASRNTCDDKIMYRTIICHGKVRVVLALVLQPLRRKIVGSAQQIYHRRHLCVHTRCCIQWTLALTGNSCAPTADTSNNEISFRQHQYVRYYLTLVAAAIPYLWGYWIYYILALKDIQNVIFFLCTIDSYVFSPHSTSSCHLLLWQCYI